MSKNNNFWDSLPTLGSVRERLGFFASTTEAGELNTVLNDAYELLGKYEQE